MTAALNESLLRHVALVGEVSGHDLVKKVNRFRNDYTDFYGIAAMIHSGYIAADTADGAPFGGDVQETATMLCQLSLPKGASFTFNGCSRESWWDFPVTFFITGPGVLKVEQLDERRAAKLQKRKDYIVSALVAILAAVLSSTATHLYALHREAANKAAAPAPKVSQPSSNKSFKPNPLRGSA